MQSKATTVEQYLAELPADRRAVISAVRKVIRANLDRDFEERMQYGMIGYCVPHRVYPAGYHCDPRQPLPFAALASQKHYFSLFLMTLYSDGDHLKRFEQGWTQAGKKLDMGKCCVRFKRLEDAALDVIGDAIGRVTARQYIAYYENSIKGSRIRQTAPRSTVTAVKKKSAAKTKPVAKSKPRAPLKKKPAKKKTLAKKKTATRA